MTTPLNPEDARTHEAPEEGHTAALPDTGAAADHTDEPAETATDNPAASEEPTTER